MRSSPLAPAALLFIPSNRSPASRGSVGAAREEMSREREGKRRCVESRITSPRCNTGLLLASAAGTRRRREIETIPDG
jgi:hypothetical protein